VKLHDSFTRPPVIKFIYGQNYRNSCAAGSFRNLYITRKHTIPSINQKDDEVGSLKSSEALLGNHLSEGITASSEQPPGIYQLEGDAVPFYRLTDNIPCRAGY
jgi:hypothetical protein